jgi:hypothetical protein
MAVEYGIIYNPSNLIFKYEVWMKGLATYTDSLAQPIVQRPFCEKCCSFVTRKGAEKFAQYDKDIRNFRGSL